MFLAQDGKQVLINKPYRPDIDGLRAIAVLAVIAHHFDKAILPNGYLGVDIFFVISGYVVTQSLVSSERGAFGSYLLNFYSRRVRRLLPALFLCVSVTFLLVFTLMPPGQEAEEFVRTGAMALFGVSNIFLFWKSSDYFSASAEANPFTHTWSLGVEEQFYLLYPALLWVTGYTLARQAQLKRFLLIIGTAALLSLIAFAYATFKHEMAAFYLMPMRFWELALGAMAFALRHRYLNDAPKSKSLTNLVVSACLILMLAVLAVSWESAQPAAIYLVVAASFLVLLGNSGESLVSRLLTLRVFVFIGLISYSLYLWHWSVLSISRATIGVSEATIPYQLAAILLLSVFSYQFVEQPMRGRASSASQGSSKRKIAVIGVAFASAILIAATATRFGAPMHERGQTYTGEFAPLLKTGSKSLRDKRELNGFIWDARKCISSIQRKLRPVNLKRCTFGDFRSNAPRLLVIGDSYAAAELEMYTAVAASGRGPVTATASWGAGPKPGNHGPRWGKANDYYWQTVIPSLLKGLKKGDIVLMIFRATDFMPSRPNPRASQRLEDFRDWLAEFTRELSERGISVIYQGGIPFVKEWGCTPNEAAQQWWHIAGLEKCKYQSREYTVERRRPYQQMLMEMQENSENFHVFDLFEQLCPESDCKYYDSEGVFLYRDESGHLSVEASTLARDSFLRLYDEVIARGINQRPTNTRSGNGH